MNLEIFRPLINILPEVQVPEVKPALKKRIIWTVFALLVFTILGLIMPVGMAAVQQSEYLESLQLITASKIGTLATLGIGPIVMASIILQLLTGAKLLNFDLKDPNQKKLFQGVQKLLAIFFCLFEAIIYVMTGFMPAAPGIANFILLIAQLAIASVLIMYLDELVSKYGIGSGVGLFIAAGVSFSIVWRAFSWVPSSGKFIGLVPNLMQGIFSGSIDEMAIFPLIFTVIVFLLVVYAESIKIEIPLTFGKIRGFGARYPLKFFYVSNIPVIFAAALFSNIEIMGMAMSNAGIPLLGSFVSNQPVSGIAYYLKAPYGALGSPTQIGITLGSFDLILRIIIYTAVLMIFCVMFGKFWVGLSNMDSKSVAGQLQNVGLHVPGFRRDPRVVEMVLDRYIPVITVLGAMAVGAIAVLADLTGALGTGTGILLTVGIIYKMYEELAAEQAFEMMPGLKNIMGG
ncbi:MAG: preprotein translocase subunit SecY [Candidatus Micrarchaeota archaeon]